MGEQMSKVCSSGWIQQKLQHGHLMGNKESANQDAGLESHDVNQNDESNMAAAVTSEQPRGDIDTTSQTIHTSCDSMDMEKEEDEMASQDKSDSLAQQLAMKRMTNNTVAARTSNNPTTFVKKSHITRS